jgi:D-alanyl-D-alanine carboxypeptidase
MSKKVIFGAVAGLFVVGGFAYYFMIRSASDTETSSSTQTTTRQTNETASGPAGFNKNLYGLDEPGSPWWIVNKTRPLPAGYVPPDLIVPNVKLRLAPNAEQMQFSKSALSSLEEMFEAARQNGVGLVFGSGYRSEAYQRTLYNGYVANDGQAAADKYSARPGYSEHQTGLSFDATASNGACHLEKCFSGTQEGKWLAANAYKYGFIIRYPVDKEFITGYDYEPWHMRYIGRELAIEMQNTGIQTLEEFFGLPDAPNYN